MASSHWKYWKVKTSSLTRIVALIAIALTTALGGGAAASAQDRDEATAGLPFFREEGIDFWRKETLLARKDRRDSNITTSIWAEPIRMPDGRYTTYLPPEAVRRFLDSPSRETARAYVAWQEDRARKLKAAMDVLHELDEEKRRGDLQKPSEEHAAQRGETKAEVRSEKEKKSAGSAEILYFKKKDCPYCLEEDKVLATLAKNSPGVKVRIVMSGDEPGLWRDYHVTVVPTLLISGAGEKKILVRGYLPADQLTKILVEAGHVGK